MRHSLPIAPQFYVTAPQPCPYLEGRVERKLFTALHGNSANKLNDALSHQGFRRSQNVLYRPSCADCSACMSARVPVATFKPSRSQRRILEKNADLSREAATPWATEDQFELFRRYLDSRHALGGMAQMNIFEYAAMIEESPVRSRIVEYYRPDPTAKGKRELVAVCLTDVLSDGLSLVYSFFDPDLARNSLGSFMILDHIRLAGEAGLDYVYLGYWVPGSAKMDYKIRYRPIEIHRAGRWQLLGEKDVAPRQTHPLALDPISAQVAAIHLPQIP